MVELPTTRFVILAVPRTGSNLLCTLLNSHPEILCHHEVFNPQGIYTALTHRNQILDLGSLQERDRNPLAFLDQVWQTGDGQRCIGFKWTRGQNEDVLRTVVGDRAVKKFVLRRCNRIKTYISDKIAQQTQQWEVYSKDDLHLPRPRIAADKEELLAHISTNARFYGELLSSLRRMEQPHIETTYEALFDKAEQRRLLEFLGICDLNFHLEAASVKQNPTDLRDSISNFAEFRESLCGSDLQPELNDPGM